MRHLERRAYFSLLGQKRSPNTVECSNRDAKAGKIRNRDSSCFSLSRKISPSDRHVVTRTTTTTTRCDLQLHILQPNVHLRNCLRLENVPHERQQRRRIRFRGRSPATHQSPDRSIASHQANSRPICKSVCPLTIRNSCHAHHRRKPTDPQQHILQPNEP